MGTCSGLIFTTSWQRQRWLVPTRVELWNFSHCFGQHWSCSTFSTKNTATNASFRTNTWPSTPPPPTSRGQRVFGDRLWVQSNLWRSFYCFLTLFEQTATSLTAPESQQPAYVSGEFHERHHPALSSRISPGRCLKTTGLSSAWARSKTSGQIDSKSAGIFWWFSPLPQRRRRNTQSSSVLKGQDSF